MRILIVNTGIIPVTLYGGTERVIWGLGKELTKLGHTVTFLVNKGSHCDFAKVIFIDENIPIIDQISDDYDVIHFNFKPKEVEKLKIPYIITMHGNTNNQEELDHNTVFVSQNHANRYGSKTFVHNGLDWSEYLKPELSLSRNYFHFLGKAAWRIKNVKGAIDTVRKTKNERLKILGGVRFNIKMGIRFTFSSKISFEGMVGGDKKYKLINASKGLIIPVLWHEPFGLAITESLFYGCPVFGTPYGSLPELVTKEYGFLTSSESQLREAILNSNQYSKQKCHEYAVETFNSKVMTQAYLQKYEEVLAGRKVNLQTPKLLQIQEQKFLNWNE